YSAPCLSMIYALSLHDALPISVLAQTLVQCARIDLPQAWRKFPLPHSERLLFASLHQMECSRSLRTPRFRYLRPPGSETPFVVRDRKSTRLNSSHVKISYAVFC